MLKQRLLTAAILLPFIIASILYLPTLLIALMVIGVAVLANLEWLKIVGYRDMPKLIFAMSVLAFAMLIGWMLSVSTLAVIVLIVWGASLLVLFSFANKAVPAAFSSLALKPIPTLIIANIMLALFVLTSVRLLQATGDIGRYYLLYVLLLVVLVDSGGYFVGKRWGKTPLSVTISPNKTWEGVLGGLLMALVGTELAYVFDIAELLTWYSWLILSVVTILIAMVGDLFESLFKRHYGIKDSGKLLPGHGGILDRIDGLIAAVPVFTTGLFFLGVY